MGFGDLIKNATNKATDLVKNEIEKQAEEKRLQAQRQAEIRVHLAEQQKMQKVMLQINSGFQFVNVGRTAAMFQRQDGTVYFGSNYDDRFLFIEYSWNGPQYEVFTTSVSNSTGKEVTKGKSGKMLAGAAVGALAGPAGMVVGAAIGAGGKKKKNINSHSNTNSVQRQTEVLTPATLKFKNMDTNAIVSIVIGCNSLIDSQIKGFQISQEQSLHDVSKDASDALQGVKALKELLDMGALTEEEFEAKKKQLLQI